MAKQLKHHSSVSSPLIRSGTKSKSLADHLDELPPSATRRTLLSNWAGFAFTFAGQGGDAGIAGSGDPWQNWTSLTNKLVRRITFGITAQESKRAAQIGFLAYLEEQLNPGAIHEQALESTIVKRWPRTTWQPPQLYGINDDWISTDHLVQSTVFRAVKSRKQLQEKMVELWCDHFNMWADKAWGGQLITCVRDVIRPNALTNFPTLLRGVLGHPSMLIYLDNVYNYGDFPNINFAREILELHTVSVTGGYTTTDIKNLARALTGWSVDDGSVSQANKGRFQYRSYYHSVGQKSVMGHAIPMGQQSEGEDIIAWLGMHPKTAEFIAKKLVARFVSHTPDPTLVQQVANVYLSTGGDIKSMLRVVLSPLVIQSAPAKLKRPFHLAVSGLRTNESHIHDMGFLRWFYLPYMGQVPFNWEPPDGYPDRIDYWAASTLQRLQFGYGLANNEVWGIDYQPKDRWDSLTADQALTMINNGLFGGEASNQDRTSINNFLVSRPLTEVRLRAAYAIALASPSFQYY